MVFIVTDIYFRHLVVILLSVELKLPCTMCHLRCCSYFWWWWWLGLWWQYGWLAVFC